MMVVVKVGLSDCSQLLDDCCKLVCSSDVELVEVV